MAGVRASQRLKTRKAGINLVPVIKRLVSKRLSPPMTLTEAAKERKTEALNHSTQDALCKVEITSSQSLENIDTSKSTSTIKVGSEMELHSNSVTQNSDQSKSDSQEQLESLAIVGKKRKRPSVEERVKSRSYKRRKKHVMIVRGSEAVNDERYTELFTPSESDHTSPPHVNMEVIERLNVEDIDAPISDSLREVGLNIASIHTTQCSVQQNLTSNNKRGSHLDNLIRSHTSTTHSISAAQHFTCVRQNSTPTDPLTTNTNKPSSCDKDTLTHESSSYGFSTTSPMDTAELLKTEEEHPQPSTPKQKMSRCLARQRQLKEMRIREAAFERQQRLLQRKGLLNRPIIVEDSDVKRKRISWKEECDLVQVFVYSPPREVEEESSESLNILPR